MRTPPLDMSVRVVWALANHEAKAAGCSSIEPVHCALAILKVLDPSFRLSGIEASDTETLEEVFRRGLEMSGLSGSEVAAKRRSLKLQVRTGTPLDVTGLLHRSEQTKAMFGRAAERARFEAAPMVSFHHLLPDLSSFLTAQRPVASQRPQHSPQKAGSVIEDLGRDLTKLAREGRLPVVVGRDAEMIQVARVLERTSKRNAIVIGPAGVGKTAIVEGLAVKLAARSAGDSLSRLRFVQVNVSDLVAGTTYRGDMEQRLKSLVEEATADPDLVLFLDEVHLIVRGGSTSGGAMDIGNILKPALGREDFRCIGATTTEEFHRYVEPDGALLRRFQVITVAEPSVSETLNICRSVAARISTRQGVSILDEAIVAAVKLSVAQMPSRRLPDKAIDLLENAAVRVKVTSLSLKERVPSKTSELVVTEVEIVAALAEMVR